jgi:hypothetical protein
MEILLNSDKNTIAVNVDNTTRVSVDNKVKLLTEYTVNDIISADDVFNDERETNEIYRIHGGIEYLSLLNGVKNVYNSLSDFFNPQTTLCKNIYNSFDFYLLRSKSFVNILDGNTPTSGYTRYFEVIATPADFNIFNAGFSNNVYGEQSFTFVFNKDFDISNYFDSLGFPITELFLYPLYKTKANGFNYLETLSRIAWKANNTFLTRIEIPNYNYTPQLNIGDSVYGDMLSYDLDQYTETVISGQSYQITTPVYYMSSPHNICWKYNPFIPLPLRYFANDLSGTNSGSTAYDDVVSIPNYAIEISGGNFVWRNILQQGFFDPVSGLGVAYPFINGKRYLFLKIILDVSPDLSDSWTSIFFTHISYGTPNLLNIIPISDVNQIGKPC